MRLSNRTPGGEDGNGQAKYFAALPLTKWPLLITGRYQCSPKKPICYWLKEISIVLGPDNVRFYMLLLEVHLGQFSSENAALINLPP
jgi:hypothetical protein